MKLILLGTTGYHPNDRRHTACLLLPDCGVMLDAGTGMYRTAGYLRTSELDIFLSHAHLDHVIGLTFLLDIDFVHPLRRVTVHGDAQKLQAIDEHLFAEPLFPTRPKLQFQPLDGPVSLAAGGQLTYFPLEHRGGSLGFRLDWPGHSMAYVTDTVAAIDAPYLDKIRGVDLLLHECYFSDAQAKWAKKLGHSHTTAVAELARAAEVKRLVLIHLDPLSTADDPVGIEAARKVFPNTQLGEDLMELEF